jgi:acyl carrier protein
MTPDSKAKLTADLCQLAATLAWLEPEDVTSTTSLSHIGVDSLGSIELIAHVEAHLGMMFPETEFPPLDSIAEIVRFAERSAEAVAERSVQ